MTDATGAAQIVTALRTSFEEGLTRPLGWRRQQLRGLERLLAEHETDLLEAMAADFGRPAIEATLVDLSVVTGEVRVMLHHLERWAKPQRVSLPLIQLPGQARVVPEPLGVALVIAPWNYLALLLVPMASALAAGNCVVVKPSELSPATSAAVARWLPRYLDERAVTVVEGGPEETQALLAERFDTIFFTGSERIGRLVMEAAARHLTPVTMELGGKSPVIVAADADLATAARRIAWGKFVNAGQTCVAPDYVLVDRSVEAELVDRLGSTISSFYGHDPHQSPDFARIVSDRHFQRLSGLLAETPAMIAAGGQTDPSDRYIAPTVLTGVAPDDPLMDDEIFGPLLPVLAVDDVEAAIRFVNSRPKPLALYVFTRSETMADLVVERTSSGGVGVNCTVQHVGVPDLPFGGVGASGFGSYHGRYGFDTFSHRKAVLAKPSRPDPPIAYPPYNRIKGWLLRRLQ